MSRYFHAGCEDIGGAVLCTDPFITRHSWRQGNTQLRWCRCNLTHTACLASYTRCHRQAVENDSRMHDTERIHGGIPNWWAWLSLHAQEERTQRNDMKRNWLWQRQHTILSWLHQLLYLKNSFQMITNIFIFSWFKFCLIYSSGQTRSPESISAWTSRQSFPSTVHPTETQVPRISFTVPENSLAMDFSRMVRAIS